jgi:DnaK suppressor protein
LINNRNSLSDSLDLREKEKRSIEQAAQDQAAECEDRAQDSSLKENNQTLEDKWRQQREAISRALAKIDDGTYGLSDLSGDTIPMSRLEAFPEAIRTVAEEEQIAKRNAL